MYAGSAADTGRPGTGEPGTSGFPFAPPPRRLRWKVGDTVLDVERPRVMGILNLTPDSFSDGGELGTVDEALGRAEAMIRAGADLLDVGGESTRPGASEVPAAEERRRILPFLERAAERFDVPLSVDTRKAEVARAAVEAGARIVNDVSGLTHDPEMAPLLAETDVGVVVMHMRGRPETMRSLASYDDVVDEVKRELAERLEAARDAGIDAARIVADPGIGFAKDARHSLRAIRELRSFRELETPLLVGPSRKSFLGAVLGTPVHDRLEGTLAACVLAYVGGARIFRVHDVGPVVRALRVARAVERGSPDRGGGGGSDATEART